MNWHQKHEILWLKIAEQSEDLVSKWKEAKVNPVEHFGIYMFLTKYKVSVINKLWPDEPRHIPNGCFACQEAEKRVNDNSCICEDDTCEVCPLQWPDGLTCDDDGSLYDALCDAICDNKTKRIKALCRKIAEVPECTEEEYEEKIQHVIDG